MFDRNRMGTPPGGVVKRSNLILLLLALVFSLLATLLVWRQLTQVRSASGKVQTTPVLVVVKAVPARQVVDSSDVAIRQVPVSAVESGALTTLPGAVGHYTATQWFAGQQVIAPMVVQSASPASFALQVPKGERAYTLPDDAVSGVDHLVSSGDRVDILVTFSGAPNRGPVAEQLLQNIEVLNVDKAPAGSAANGTGNSSGTTSSASDTITFAVTPEQANLLDYGATYGQLHFVLRPPNEPGGAHATPVTPGTVGPAMASLNAVGQ